MIGKSGPTQEKLFTYMRYNADLSESGLCNLGLGEIDAIKVQSLDAVDQMDNLQKIGKKIAEQIDVNHYEIFLP